MPKFSVIVPAFNVEQYIDRCVTSVLNQTYSDFELIIIDDGSTDESGKKIDSYALMDSRVRVIHSKNQGQSSARNIGLSLCTGEYIYFCDSDDWIEPTLLEKCLRKIENEHADIVRFQCFTHIRETINHSGFAFPKNTVQYQAPDNKLSFLCDYVLRYKVGWELWLGIYRKEIIKNNCIQFPSGINIAEDLYFLILNIFFGASCTFIDEPLYHYCLREESTMGQAKGQLRLNETNELLYMLCKKATNQEIKDKFYIIHNEIVIGEIEGKLPPLTDRKTEMRFKEVLDEISHYDFFVEQIKKAKAYLKRYYIKKYGFIKGKKRNLLNRYIINRNYLSYRLSLWFMEIINKPIRITKRIKN